MEETRLDARTWSQALELYKWLCTFVGVGAREHDEWWLDAGAVMRLQAHDPRGWEFIDPYEGEEERLDDPLFPWLDTPSAPGDAERFRKLVWEVPRASVRSLIVLLGAGTSRSDLTTSPNWEERLPERERRAELILSRFPEGTCFYTNLSWKGENPDFYRQSSRGHNSFSQFDWDAGLIAVNDDEVAVLWNFLST
ncbi:hypothetical protein ACIBI4_08710 [Streptomyces sp. NPDC050418]|uniref:hypothetical protein n=1 Tax=Streptomyces sp. NPDC050418 TaxID=3365612 RepID=UPI00378E8538